MQSVLSRSLEIYQRGHFGGVPKKITIHKNINQSMSKFTFMRRI